MCTSPLSLPVMRPGNPHSLPCGARALVRILSLPGGPWPVRFISFPELNSAFSASLESALAHGAHWTGLVPRPAGVAEVRYLRRALRSRPSTVKSVVAKLSQLPNPQQTARIGSPFIDPLPLYIQLPRGHVASREYRSPARNLFMRGDRPGCSTAPPLCLLHSAVARSRPCAYTNNRVSMAGLGASP
jgi:hypothetical protein